MQKLINFEDFTKLDIRVGTIISVVDFPEAHNPSFKLTIDFGFLGIKKSSAQITVLYSEESLLGKQVLAVVNLPTKQIATFNSECLILGAVFNNNVILLKPEAIVPKGNKVS